MSLDGYIAGLNDSLDFLATVEKEGEDYGYAAFLETVDSIIIGRKSYDKVLSMKISYQYTNKEVYIITRTPKPNEGSFHYYTGGLKELVVKLKYETTLPRLNIYCDGGAEIVNELMKDNLIDEYIISIIPVMLGNGVTLFHDKRPSTKLKLIATKTFESGLVQLRYTTE